MVQPGSRLDADTQNPIQAEVCFRHFASVEASSRMMRGRRDSLSFSFFLSAAVPFINSLDALGLVARSFGCLRVTRRASVLAMPQRIWKNGEKNPQQKHVFGRSPPIRLTDGEANVIWQGRDGFTKVM